ncbi:MAG: hypothetical protein VB118_00115 [Oscillospiraceae bacterium]|nr:hypothetical protein [Oscillospiraceae bacterium]
MPDLIYWKKNQSMIFLDKSTTGTPTWARIGKSELYEIAMNPNIVTRNFIDDELPTNDVENYQPSMSQELVLVEGDPAFDFVFSKLYSLPTGNAAAVNALFVFPQHDTTATTSYLGWNVSVALVLNSYNAIDKKIKFDLKFNGNIKRGTVAVTDGTPVFTAAA